MKANPHTYKTATERGMMRWSNECAEKSVKIYSKK
jgi:hypothetical protein